MKRVDVAGAPALVLYNVDGEYFATADRCTHSRASLSEGELDGDCVVCPVHFARFHVPTGTALTFPARTDLATFSVDAVGDHLYVVVNEAAIENTEGAA